MELFGWYHHNNGLRCVVEELSVRFIPSLVRMKPPCTVKGFCLSESPSYRGGPVEYKTRNSPSRRCPSSSSSSLPSLRHLAPFSSFNPVLTETHPLRIFVIGYPGEQPRVNSSGCCTNDSWVQSTSRAPGRLHAPPSPATTLCATGLSALEACLEAGEGPPNSTPSRRCRSTSSSRSPPRSPDRSFTSSNPILADSQHIR